MDRLSICSIASIIISTIIKIAILTMRINAIPTISQYVQYSYGKLTKPSSEAKL